MKVSQAFVLCSITFLAVTLWDDRPVSAAAFSFTNLPRKLIADLTGKNATEYKFGDITRTVVTNLTGKDASEYKFGDITRTAVANFTKKSEYEFGDITRTVLSHTEKKIQSVTGSTLTGSMDKLPAVFSQMSPEQRMQVQAIVVRIGVLALLTYSFIFNVTRAMTVVLAWKSTCTKFGLSPLAAGQWSSFLETHATLCLFSDPLFIPFRVGGTIFLTPLYGDVVYSMQGRLPLRSRYPLVNRVLALGFCFVVGNCLTVLAMALLGVWMAGVLAGVPAFA